MLGYLRLSLRDNHVVILQQRNMQEIALSCPGGTLDNSPAIYRWVSEAFLLWFESRRDDWNLDLFVPLVRNASVVPMGLA